MYCDIYSLGQGEVNATAPGGVVFGLKNLQVERGYMHRRIPAEVLALACGSMGAWVDPGDGSVPMCEIVEHHGAPKAYPQLDPEYRTPAIQCAGVANRVKLGARARSAITPRKSRVAVAKRPKPPAQPEGVETVPGFRQPLTIEEVSPNLKKLINNPAAPKPDPIAEAGGASANPETGPPAQGARPSIADGANTPKIADMTGAPPAAAPKPLGGDAVEAEVVDEEHASEAEEQTPVTEVPEVVEDDGVCVGVKGDGVRCARQARARRKTCYSHKKQEPEG